MKTHELSDKFQFGLLLKVGLLVVLTTSFALVGFGLYQSRYTSVHMTQTLRERLSLTADRLAINLREPLFLYNKGRAENMISAEMGSRLISGVFVTERETVVPGFGFSKDTSERVVPTETLLPEDGHMLEVRDIRRGEATLGEVKVFATLRYLQKDFRQTLTDIVIQVFLVDILIVLSLILSIRTLITKPISECVRFARSMSTGDFSQTLTLKNKDEIGNLTLALNSMTSHLAEMFNDIADGIEFLLSSSTELSTISQQMTAGAEQTTIKANTVAGATEEMSTNINAMASAAEEMSVTIHSVSSTADQMSQNMSSVSSAIKDISVSISDIAESVREGSTISVSAMEMAKTATSTMNKLGDAAMEVDEVTEVIKKITEQTNLLAINAAIEAASAGAAGKGFAVVANEIKELAGQSAEAAENIVRRIGDIQKNTIKAVRVIDDVSDIISNIKDSSATTTGAVEQQIQTISDISANANQASTGVENIASSIAEISRGANDMSRNAGEAANGVNEVASNIQGVSHATVGSHAAASQVSDSANELSRVAGELKQMISKFKTGASSPREEV